MRAAGVLRHVASDGAHLLGRRIGRVEITIGSDLLRDKSVDCSRLNRDSLVGDIDFKNPAHARQAEHNAIGHRQRAAAQAGSGAARDKWNLVLMADANRRLHLLAVFRQQNGRGQHPEIGQAVALIGLELIGLGNQSARAKHGAKCIQNLPVHSAISCRSFGSCQN